MNEINVEKIMDEIRAQIPEGEAGWEKLRFEDVPVENGSIPESGGLFERAEFDQEVKRLAASCEVEYFHPIPGGKLKRFVKRVLRKLIRFCVEPICAEVTDFHKRVARSLQHMRRFVSQYRAESLRREEELEALRAEVEALRGRIEELERKA